MYAKKGKIEMNKQKKSGKIKAFFGEFKTFISRGNVVDMSVAVVVGGAFSAIVTALTNKIVMPLVNWILALCGGKNGLESAYTILSPYYNPDGTIDLTKSVYIDWGAFIAAIFNFLIIAFVIFSLVKILNASKLGFKKFEDDLLNQKSRKLWYEKRQVKALAKEQNRPFKEVWQEYLDKKAKEEKQKLEEENKKKELEEQKKREENKTSEQLLQEIIVLLKQNNDKTQIEKTEETT